ncbi:hypothetical protein GCM10007148_23110 [Parvularcula lutaonensis]|nr:hypothetical protein GCM10007148_23110 [Parvularcula lutaonensis]
MLDAARRSLVARDKAGIGDVLLFRMRRSMPVSHCGILIAPDRFVHAYEGQAVISTPLSEFWQTRISGVFAFPEVP